MSSRINNNNRGLCPPPEGWFDNNLTISDFVKTGNFGNQLNLFKQEIIKGIIPCDIDNITAIADRGNVKGLVISVCRNLTVEIANSQHSSMPAGYAILSKNPLLFVKESDKHKILMAASSDKFGHFRYFGNENPKVIFRNQETFTNDKFLKLILLAEVDTVMFVSYAMKGDLKWGHNILHTLKHIRPKSPKIIIDFAATVPPHLCHWARENTHQMARPYNKKNRSGQSLPLVMVDQKDAAVGFGDNTRVSNFPICMDAQMSHIPKVVPLFGTSTISPSISPAETDNIKDVALDCGQDSSILNQNLKDVKGTENIKIYSDFHHLAKQTLMRERGDILSKANNVRNASRRANAVSASVPSAMDAGVVTGLRFEVRKVFSNHFDLHDTFGESDGEESDMDDSEDGEAPKWIINQFDPFLRDILIAFSCCRIITVPLTTCFESWTRMWLFAKMGKLPVSCQCLSGSKDRRQVGDMWQTQDALQKGILMARGASTIYGDKWDSNACAYFGSTTNPPSSSASRPPSYRDDSSESSSGDSDDDDPEWLPQWQNSSSHTQAATSTSRSSRVLTERRDGGMLSRDLDDKQQSFLAILIANMGVSNLTASKLCLEQYKFDPDQLRNNAILWISIEAWSSYLLLMSQNWLQETREEFHYSQYREILNQFIPEAADAETCPAEIESGGSLSIRTRCFPPSIINHDNHCRRSQEMTFYVSRKVPTPYWAVISQDSEMCLSFATLQQVILLRVSGMLNCDHFRSILSVPTAPIDNDSSPEEEFTDDDDDEFVKEVAEFVRVDKPSKKNLVIRNQLGNNFCSGATAKEAILACAKAILSGTREFGNKKRGKIVITPGNWKECIAQRTESKPGVGGEEQHLLFGEGNNDDEVLAWEKKRLVFLLTNLLKIHTISAGGKKVFWSQWNLGGQHICAKDSAQKVVRSVCNIILKNSDRLEGQWHHLMETNGFQMEAKQNIDCISFPDYPRAVRLSGKMKSLVVVDKFSMSPKTKDSAGLCIRYKPSVQTSTPFVVSFVLDKDVLSTIDKTNEEIILLVAAHKLLTLGLEDDWRSVLLCRTSRASHEGYVPPLFSNDFLLREEFSWADGDDVPVGTQSSRHVRLYDNRHCKSPFPPVDHDDVSNNLLQQPVSRSPFVFDQSRSNDANSDKEEDNGVEVGDPNDASSSKDDVRVGEDDNRVCNEKVGNPNSSGDTHLEEEKERSSHTATDANSDEEEDNELNVQFDPDDSGEEVDTEMSDKANAGSNDVVAASESEVQNVADSSSGKDVVPEQRDFKIVFSWDKLPIPSAECRIGSGLGKAPDTVIYDEIGMNDEHNFFTRDCVGHQPWSEDFFHKCYRLRTHGHALLFELGTYQGRLAADNNPLTDSSNGCTVISILLIRTLLELKGKPLLISDINAIIDKEAPLLLNQIRKADYFQNDSNSHLLDVEDSVNYLNQHGYTDLVCIDTVGGFVTDDDFEFYEVKDCCGSDYAPIAFGIILTFNEHTISVFKSGTKYIFTESLPVWTERGICISCGSLDAVFHVLKHYAKNKMKHIEIDPDSPPQINGPLYYQAKFYMTSDGGRKWNEELESHSCDDEVSGSNWLEKVDGSGDVGMEDAADDNVDAGKVEQKGKDGAEIDGDADVAVEANVNTGVEEQNVKVDAGKDEQSEKDDARSERDADMDTGDKFEASQVEKMDDSSDVGMDDTVDDNVDAGKVEQSGKDGAEIDGDADVAVEANVNTGVEEQNVKVDCYRLSCLQVL